MTPRPSERGIILLNVLLFIAIAAGIVALMLTRGDGAGERALARREAARADAIARGGEMSAIVALRRDKAVAPQADSADEPWGRVTQHDTAIAGGRFSLVVTDATGRFDINAGGPLFDRVASAVGIAPADAARARDALRLAGPVTDLRRLADRLDPALAARLGALVTALPVAAPTNLNAVDAPLLSLLVGDTAKAVRLIARRTRAGHLTAGDLGEEGVAMPPGAAFTSDLYWVRIHVVIGDTARQWTSLLRRRVAADGRVEVAPIARWIGPRPPLQAPALP